MKGREGDGGTYFVFWPKGVGTHSKGGYLLKSGRSLKKHRT